MSSSGNSLLDWECLHSWLTFPLKNALFIELQMHKARNRNASFWKIIVYGFAIFILLMIFSAYYAPEMMMSITNQVWALCGW
jgi:hypothetical protein